MGVSTASIAQDTDDPSDEPQRLPGIAAIYFTSDSDQPLVARYDALPIMRLAADESPDPRLSPAAWRATWQGVIDAPRPGEYRFAAQASGRVTITIGGDQVLSLDGPVEEPQWGEPVRLEVGLQPIAITFEPSGPAAQLKLFWQSEDFALEPLPARALGHLETDPAFRDPFFHGQLTIEEHSCMVCHVPGPDASIASQLGTRPGPRLTSAGNRLKAGWIYDWLADPQRHRPEAVMPRLFSADRQGEVERYALATYLASQGPALVDDRSINPTAALVADGESLYRQIGCVVCHESSEHHPARATLRGLSRKTTIAALAAYLQNPLAVDPAGRMPSLAVLPTEATPLAAYLMSRDTEQIETPIFPATPSALELARLALPDNATETELQNHARQPVDSLLEQAAKRLFVEKQCASCHELVPHGATDPLRSAPAKADFRTIVAHSSQGCLDADPDQVRQGVPRFGKSLDVAAARAFLSALNSAPGTKAPEYAARLTIERLNCLACHVRHDQGGLDPKLADELVQDQSEQNAEAVRPPDLTSVVGKLNEPALRGVLERGERARPWMALRMPQFSAEHVQPLVACLAAADAEPLTSGPLEFPRDDELIAAGRALVGSKGFGCTKCHDMLGVASTGTRGPDLAHVTRRLNYDWYLRWMTDSQRLQPGTRMPTVFLEGQSPYTDLLDGDAAKQREAMWRYLAVSDTLPPPAGSAPTASYAMHVSEKIEVVRTFMPGTSARGIALGHPNGVHLAYDAQSCRLAYAWTGDFLDMRPVWTGRGGREATLLGPTIWTSPAGFPWDVTAIDAAPPDFAGRGADTSLGAVLPHDGKLHPSRLRFHGYRESRDKTTLRFDLELPESEKVRFIQELSTQAAPDANSFRQRSEITAPHPSTIWFHAGLSSEPPRWRDGAQSGVLDQSGEPASRLVTIVDQGQPLLWQLRNPPANAQWVAVPFESQWRLLLRVSAPDANPKRITLDLVTWIPTEQGKLLEDRLLAEELDSQESDSAASQPAAGGNGSTGGTP